MKFYQLVFMVTLMMGSIIAISASNWFTCWLGLEINLISMIPLMMIKLNPLSTETAIKYFLVQAMASLILIFSSISSSIIFFFNPMDIFNIIIFLTLIMKAGIPPLHFWFPQVMKNSNWNVCALLLTWQKIAPLMLLSHIEFNMLLIFCIILSCLIGPLGGLNQVNLKSILTYSSITHSAWMLSIVFFTFNLWMMYFVVYTTISLSVIQMLKKINLNSLKQMIKTNVSTEYKILLTLSIMSMGGLPPMLGFIPKLMAAQTLMNAQMQLVAATLIMASLLSLFYYIRTLHSFLLMKQMKINIKQNNSTKMSMKPLLMITTIGNIVVPLGLFLV